MLIADVLPAVNEQTISRIKLAAVLFKRGPVVIALYILGSLQINQDNIQCPAKILPENSVAASVETAYINEAGGARSPVRNPAGPGHESN